MKLVKSIFTGAFIVMFMIASAQDTIYKTDGSRIVAKIMEINASSVKYKFVGNGTEIILESEKNEISYIAYSNGVREMYNMNVQKKENPITDDRMIAKPQEHFLKNIIALNCFEMVFTNFSISYERIFPSGTYSLKVPLSMGLGGKPNQNDYSSEFGSTQFLQNRLYSSGLEFNIYPLGQTKHIFYIGLSAMAGSFYYYENIITTGYNGYNGYYQQVIGSSRHIGSHYSGTVHLGGYLRLSDNFSIGMKFGLGYKREETVELDYTIPRVQFDFNLAYKF